MLMAELGAAFPVEGGPYEWARMAFGRLAGAITAILYWLSNPIWMGGTLAAATIAALDGLILHKTLGTGWEIAIGLIFVWVTVAIAIMAFKYGKWGPIAISLSCPRWCGCVSCTPRPTGLTGCRAARPGCGSRRSSPRPS